MTTAPASINTARVIIEEKSADTVAVSIPGSHYVLHFSTLTEVAAEVGSRCKGTIRAKATKRVDECTTGGRWIEPLVGQPRNIQGEVLEADASANTITVNAVVPMVVTLFAGQKAADFPVGTYVTASVRSDATFAPKG